ncbi:alpha-L-fucosidase [Lutibacter citreus]|uniref:alpha-L-fucosidase n=1 Tax=Lutibacter citreus TaxID=2138210 RepID=UPI000DBE917D|nr:alpha-L-fucosidase [Lutibacter citreus]
MKKYIALIILVCLLSCNNKKRTSVSTQKFTPIDSSLVNYQYPEWYQDAKIGYWACWGLYSVPAFKGEWYGRHMYSVDDGSGKEKGLGFSKYGLEVAENHRKIYGDPREFEYHDFIPKFTANKFNADEWAQIFYDGGGKFFTFMAMHHDSYCLWDSDNTPYTSVKMGPKRDFTAEMKKAVKDRGMYFGVSNHSAWNGSFFEHKHYNGFKNNNEQQKWLYGTGSIDSAAVNRWWSLTTELADKYQPDLYYFDWGWNNKLYNQKRKDFLSFYYNKALDWNQEQFPSPNVVVNYKNRGKLPDGSAVLDLERGGMKGIEKYPWQNDTSLGLKWWNFGPGEEYRSPNQTIDMLMDIISKNGVLMLCIGPKADGSIPKLAQNSIRDIGKWLKINGEAVYATRPWEIYGEGPANPNEKMHGDVVEYTSKDIRFTKSKDNKTLYVTFLGWPEKAIVTSLVNLEMNNVKSITFLSTSEELKWKQNKDGLFFNFPKNISKDDFAYVVKLEFNGEIPTILN